MFDRKVPVIDRKASVFDWEVPGFDWRNFQPAGMPVIRATTSAMCVGVTYDAIGLGEGGEA